MGMADVPAINLALLALALQHGGLREFKGGRDNPEIVEMFDDTKARWVDDDETAWCSAFICHLAEDVGAHNPRTVRARRWLEVEDPDAQEVELDDLEPGDVVVLWREHPSSSKGHVGLFLQRDSDPKFIWILGGNQGNAVKPKRYPAQMFLGGRRLAAAGSTSGKTEKAEQSKRGKRSGKKAGSK